MENRDIADVTEGQAGAAAGPAEAGNNTEAAGGANGGNAGNTETDSSADGGMTIEEGFAKLQELMDRMQDDSVPLEESFRLYEEGMKLVRYCSSRIDTVEKKVEKLNAQGRLEDF
jgi:exodeoxyribonuclease VII small subunit